MNPALEYYLRERHKIDAEKPDYIFILPWNLKDEIMTQLAHARAWGAQFIIPIPEPQIVP